MFGSIAGTLKAHSGKLLDRTCPTNCFDRLRDLPYLGEVTAQQLAKR
jgi:hypothetical protein